MDGGRSWHVLLTVLLVTGLNGAAFAGWSVIAPAMLVEPAAAPELGLLGSVPEEVGWAWGWELAVVWLAVLGVWAILLASRAVLLRWERKQSHLDTRRRPKRGEPPPCVDDSAPARATSPPPKR